MVLVSIVVRVDAVAAAGPIAAAASSGLAGAAAHLIVLVLLIPLVITSTGIVTVVELPADFPLETVAFLFLETKAFFLVVLISVSGHFIDQPHQPRGVAGPLVIVHGMMSVTSGRSLRQRRSHALRRVSIHRTSGLATTSGSAAIALRDALATTVGTRGRSARRVLGAGLGAAAVLGLGRLFGTDGVGGGVGVAHEGFGFGGVVGGEAGGEGGHGGFIVAAGHDELLKDVCSSSYFVDV
mmetsp:Transcript_14804/g.26124  ORF Transcript_14804/g.26124 Transcript_14804/m.26124 type:complete len:239 (-) Transcript_14804:118-834(-)